MIKAFCIVSESLSTTPHSLHKLPNVKAPIRGQASGRNIIQSPNTTSGKTIFSRFETSRSCFISILRSASVVKSFIIGGWITGTRAIYEYAATAIAPRSSGASLVVT